SSSRAESGPSAAGFRSRAGIRFGFAAAVDMDYSLCEKYEHTSDALFWLRELPMKVELSVPAELADRELMSSAHCNSSPPDRHGATIKKSARRGNETLRRSLNGR